MPADQRLRRTQRSLSSPPQDAAAWVRAARDFERSGLHQRAQRAATRAADLDRFDPQVLTCLRELAVHGPWTSERGDPCNQQRSAVRGPREGVIHWRRELPRRTVGWPRIDMAGRVVLRGQTAGLLRADPDGHAVEVLGDWPAEVQPTLTADGPRALDARHLAPRGPGPLGDVVLAPFVDTAEWRHTLLPQSVLAQGPDEVPAWRLSVPDPTSLAVPDAGPLYLALALPLPGRVLAVERHTGELLWEVVRRQPEQGQPSVSVADDGALLARQGAELFSVGRGGRLRWRLRQRGLADPASDGQRVLITSPAAGLTCLDATTGQARWQRPGLLSERGPVIDAEGWVYVVTLQGDLAAVDPDGEVSFRLRLGGEGPAAPAVLGWDRTAFVAAGSSLIAVR